MRGCSRCGSTEIAFMKIKTARRSGKVIVEMAPRDADIPMFQSELKLKRILVPIDFSELSRKAVQYARSFAKQFNSEILLLHAIELVPVPDATFLLQDTTQGKLQAAKRLSEWRNRLLPEVSVRAVVSDSGAGATEQILNAARQSNVDLIILGTHGRTGLAHLFIGSTAEKVVRGAPCPVLVVREREHDFVESKKPKRPQKS
jgi:universal stress protein A